MNAWFGGTPVKLACYALNVGTHNPPMKPVRTFIPLGGRTLLFHQWFNTHKKSSVVQIIDTNLKVDRIKRQDCAHTPESWAYRGKLPGGLCLLFHPYSFSLIKHSGLSVKNLSFVPFLQQLDGQQGENL